MQSALIFAHFNHSSSKFSFGILVTQLTQRLFCTSFAAELLSAKLQSYCCQKKGWWFCAFSWLDFLRISSGHLKNWASKRHWLVFSWWRKKKHRARMSPHVAYWSVVFSEDEGVLRSGRGVFVAQKWGPPEGIFIPWIPLANISHSFSKKTCGTKPHSKGLHYR